MKAKEILDLIKNVEKKDDKFKKKNAEFEDDDIVIHGDDDDDDDDGDLEEKVKEKVLGDVRGISSGTWATLTGITNSSDIDFMRPWFVDFAQDSKELFNTWGDAWIAFVKSHGLKPNSKDSSVNGKELIKKLELL